MYFCSKTQKDKSQKSRETIKHIISDHANKSVDKLREDSFNCDCRNKKIHQRVYMREFQRTARILSNILKSKIG